MRRAPLAIVVALCACRRDPPRPAPPRTEMFPHRGQGCAFDVNGPVVGGPASPHAEAGAATRRPRDVHLALRDDGRSLIARWSTEPGVMASELRLQPQAGGAERVERGWSTLDPQRRDLRWHEVVVCGLSPATRYVYTVGGGASRSNPASFTTAPSLAVPVVLAVATDAAAWVASSSDIARARPDALVVPWAEGLPTRAALDRAAALLASTPLITRGQVARYGTLSFGGEGPWVMHDVDVVSRRVDGGDARRSLSAGGGWGALTVHPNRATWSPAAGEGGWDWDLSAPAARDAGTTARPGS